MTSYFGLGGKTPGGDLSKNRALLFFLRELYKLSFKRELVRIIEA